MLEENAPAGRGYCSRLKREGLPLAEIAARSKASHEGSVRRILYNIARRIAHGGGGGSDRDRVAPGKDDLP